MDAAFSLILLSLAAGYVCGRFHVFPEGAAETLNRFVIWVCLPAVVLRVVPTLTFESELIVLVLTPWFLLAASVALVRAFARFRGLDRGVTGALLLCVPLGNTSFLGFPMIGALLGEGAVRYAVLYDQLGSFFILATYGSFVVGRFSSSADSGLGAVARRVLRFPPFIALLVALLPLPRPPALDSVLAQLGAALVPVAMFAVGLTMRLRLPRERLAFTFGLAMKMGIAPLLAFAFARGLGASGLPLRVAVLEAAMPPMVTAGALAMTAGFAPRLSAALVGYGILLSVVTIPLLARLF